MHTVIAKACLGILLPSEEGDRNAEAKSNSALAKYAAVHWMNHARSEKVSTHLEVGMRLLFDPAMPYFGAWLELYDFNPRWAVFFAHGEPGSFASLCDEQRGSPLYMLHFVDSVTWQHV